MNDRLREMRELLQEEIRKVGLANVGALLKYARRLGKERSLGADCKIAVLGSCNIQYFAQALRVLLYRDGINAMVYEGEYDGIKLDVLNGDSAFYQFCPDIAVVLTDYRDIKMFPELFDSGEQVESCVEGIVGEQGLIWEAIHKRIPSCQVIMSNYVVPVERALGNLECNYAFSRQGIYRMANERLVKAHPQYVLLADLDYLASAYGKLDWFDTSAYMLGKMPFALKYTGQAADLFAKLIGACRGIVRKCIVLDLDNTLWGGIVSEEGPNGVRVDPNDAVGEAFLFFQGYLRRLRERGVILAVCSKNDEWVAREPFAMNPNMLLKLDDFAAFYANWEDKAGNIRRIAKELNIGLDSMVFFDDSPAERELVRVQLPEVAVIDVPGEPADYARALELAGCFHWAALTPEDVARAGTYQANKKREGLFVKAGDYDEYLRRLQMHGEVQPVGADMVQRFAQLINKSNQFNLRTRRYTEAELSDMLQGDDYKLLAGSLSDKFSNYGIVSCVILKRHKGQCFIDTWVMSCRVLKRGLEYLMFGHIVGAAREWGCTELVGEYIPTEKNGMAEGLLPGLGFLLGEKHAGGTCRYHYDLQKEPEVEFYIAEDGR